MEAEGLIDGLTELEGLSDAEGLMLGLLLELGLILAEGLIEGETELEGDTDALGEIEAEGLILADGEMLGLTDELGLIEGLIEELGLMEALGESEAEGLRLAEGDTLADGDKDEDGDTPALETDSTVNQTLEISAALVFVVEIVYPIWVVSSLAFVQAEASGSTYNVKGGKFGAALALVFQVVELGVIAVLELTVPAEAFLIRTLNAASAEATAAR